MTDGGKVKKKVSKRGGAFRAYVRKRALDLHENTCLKTHGVGWARDYHNVSDEEFEELWKVGHAATRRAKTSPLTSKSSFGEWTRDHRRRENAMYKQALIHQFLETTADLEDMSALVSLQDAAGSLGGAHAAHMEVNRFQRSLVADGLKKDTEELQGFQKRSHERTCEAMRTLCDEIQDIVVPFPVEIGKAVYLNFGSQQELLKAAKGMGSLSLHYSKYPGLTHGLDTVAADGSTSLLQSDVPPRKAPKRKRRLCKFAGIHVCTAQGRLCYATREAFRTTCLRSATQSNSDGRADIKLGKWCIVLTTVDEPPPADAGPVTPALPCEVIVHIARQSITLWKSTWHTLERVHEPAGEPALDETCMYTKVHDGLVAKKRRLLLVDLCHVFRLSE